MREFFRRSSSGPARDGLTLHEPSTREWGRTPEQVAYALGLLKKMRSALDNQNGQQMFDTLLSAMQEAVDAAREGKIEKDQRGYLRDCARSLWSSCEEVAEDIFEGFPTSEQIAKAHYMDIDS